MRKHWKNWKLFKAGLDVDLPTHLKAPHKTNVKLLLKLPMEILGTGPSNKSQNNALAFLDIRLIFLTWLISQIPAINRP